VSTCLWLLEWLALYEWIVWKEMASFLVCVKIDGVVVMQGVLEM
jgi:hypothetical protein